MTSAPDGQIANAKQKSRVVFHLGYPKTGTTSLQECFLAYAGVHYLGKELRDPRANALDARVAPSRRLANGLLSADTIRFEQSLPALQAIIGERLADGRPVLISDEAFTLAEYMNLATLSPTQVFTDHTVMAGRLQRLWPEATILVSVREQKSFLVSYYLQRLRGGMKFSSLDAYIDIAFATAGRRSILNALRYDEMYRAYADAFGATRVRVMAFETYRRDFSVLIAAAAQAMGLTTADAIAAWGGGHENARGRRYAHARWMHAMLSDGRLKLSPALYRRLQSIFTIVPDSVDLSPALAARLDAFFAPSNRRLESATGLKLGELGYALAAEEPAPV